jgi:hypothetical protein
MKIVLVAMTQPACVWKCKIVPKNEEGSLCVKTVIIALVAMTQPACKVIVITVLVAMTQPA